MAHTITNPRIPTITPNIVFVDETLFKLVVGFIVGVGVSIVGAAVEGTAVGVYDGCSVDGMALGVALGSDDGVCDGNAVLGLGLGTLDGVCEGTLLGLGLEKLNL